MLLSRPDEHDWARRIETVNDKDGYVSNFWRAVQAAPDDVAHWADWPVSENDLHARHYWLLERKDSIVAKLEGSPDYYDAKVAGWWVWGICAWIGSGWCSGVGPWHVIDGELVNTRKDGGVRRKLPHLGNAGMGINRKLPHLGDAGRGNCEEWAEHLRAIMGALSDRLRRVRICSGDWSRICGDTPTIKNGLTAVFLDPPYSDKANRDGNLYAVDDLDVAHDVREWAIARGGNPLYHIALCGYDTEHAMPDGWAAWQWKARGGYGSQGNGNGRTNAKRECVWFSPYCLRQEEPVALLDYALAEAAS